MQTQVGCRVLGTTTEYFNFVGTWLHFRGIGYEVIEKRGSGPSSLSDRNCLLPFETLL